MGTSFSENRPFTRSLSGRRMANSAVDALTHFAVPSLRTEDLKTDAELLTSLGEATLPSPGALNNHEDMSQFLGDLVPSPKWTDLLAKHGEWGGLGEELPSLFDAHTAFPPRANGDSAMLDTEEGINGSVEQAQPPAPADVSMTDADVGNGNVDDEAGANGAAGASDLFLSSLFDWDKVVATPSPATEETWHGGPTGPGGTIGSALKTKAPSPAAIRFTRSRSFELRKLVEKKGYPADTVMKAIDEGRVDPAVVWAKAAAENAAASRPGQPVTVKRPPAEGNEGQAGVNRGTVNGAMEKGKGRLPDMTEELKRLVNQRTQNTVPIRSTRRSPGPSPMSCLSPRLRELLNAQLPDTLAPNAFMLSESPAPQQVARKTSAPTPMTVPLNQPRHRGRPQPLKGLTSAQKIDMLRPTTSDPSSLSKKRAPSTEMLPPVKRSSSNSSDLDLGRASSSISEVVRAYSEIRTAKAPAAKTAETRPRGRAAKDTKPARKTPQPTPPAPAPKATTPKLAAAKPNAAAAAAASLPSAEQTHIQLLVKAQRADQLEEENRGLKQYLTFLSKKDGLQTKLIEQLEQQLMRLTDEKSKLMAAARKR